MNNKADIPVEDKGNVALALFMLLGCGILLPWNAFISGADYFETIYPCQHIEFTFATAYMGSLLLCMLLVVAFSHRIRKSPQVLGGYLWLLVALLASIVNRSSKSLHVLFVVFTGIGDAVVQGTLYGVVAPFPGRYMSSLMLGTTVAGVVVSIIRIATKASVSKPYSSFLAFFASAAVIVLLCIVGWVLLLRRPFVQHFYKGSSHTHTVVEMKGDDAEEEKNVQGTDSTGNHQGQPSRKLLDDDSDHADAFETHRLSMSLVVDDDHGDTSVQQNEAGTKQQIPGEVGQQHGEETGGSNADIGGLLQPSSERAPATEWEKSARGRIAAHRYLQPIIQKFRGSHIGLVFHLLLGPLLPSASAVSFNYFVTLALYPGVVAEIKSVDWGLGSWNVVLLVACFNVFDSAARVLLMYDRFQIKDHYFPIKLAVARLVFFPLMFMCAIPSWGMQNDLMAFVVTAVFAFTNGYAGTLAMIQGPLRVAEPHKVLTGTLMALNLMLGLNFGALTGDGMNALIFSHASTCEATG